MAGTSPAMTACRQRKIDRNISRRTASPRHPQEPGGVMPIARAFAAPAAIALLALTGGALAQQANMSFFITSTGPGKGADLGGLDGADRYCQTLAQAAGAGAKTWHAYLSTQAAGGAIAVNARDRIGKGPWQNAKGDVIAKDVAELHGENNINKRTALTEKGEVVNGI